MHPARERHLPAGLPRLQVAGKAKVAPGAGPSRAVRRAWRALDPLENSPRPAHHGAPFMFCPRCHRLFDGPDSRFCPHDGVELANTSRIESIRTHLTELRGALVDGRYSIR